MSYLFNLILEYRCKINIRNSASSIVFDFLEQDNFGTVYLFIFLRKDFCNTKTRHKQKLTNKTKISKH